MCRAFLSLDDLIEKESKQTVVGELRRKYCDGRERGKKFRSKDCGAYGLIFIPTNVKRERELGACVSGSEQAGQISLRFSCSTKQANIIAQAGRLVGGQTISLGHVRISFYPIYLLNQPSLF